MLADLGQSVRCDGNTLLKIKEIAQEMNCTDQEALRRAIDIAQENLIGVARDDLAAASEALWMDEN